MKEVKSVEGLVLSVEARNAKRAERDYLSSAGKKRILILGGGFAGAYTALHLEKRLGGTPDVEIMVVSREYFVLFTPMLHEVAAGDWRLPISSSRCGRCFDALA